MMSKTATALLGAAFLLAGTPALGSGFAPEVVSTSVRTSDLDLFTADGRTILDRRLERAARLVCRDVRTGLVAVARSTCFADALASGHRQRDQLFAVRGLTGDFRTAEVKR